MKSALSVSFDTCCRHRRKGKTFLESAEYLMFVSIIDRWLFHVVYFAAPDCKYDGERLHKFNTRGDEHGD